MTDTQETNEFDRVKYLENLLKISQETQEELSQRILEQQKTIESLTDTIDELKKDLQTAISANQQWLNEILN